MLYVVYGDDHQQVRRRAGEFRQALQRKRPAAEFFKLDEPRQVTVDTLVELAQSQGLFERKLIVQLDRVMDDSVAREIVLNQVSALSASDNAFLIVEGLLEAKPVKELAKHAYEVSECKVAAGQVGGMNMFSLADALGRRDRKQLWVLYQRARRELKSVEEIHGLLFWQAKAMLLARSAKSAQAAGLKQFPYTKAQKSAHNYPGDELPTLARSLVEIYHAARRGEGSLDSQLERFILSL